MTDKPELSNVIATSCEHLDLTQKVQPAIVIEINKERYLMAKTGIVMKVDENLDRIVGKRLEPGDLIEIANADKFEEDHGYRHPLS